MLTRLLAPFARTLLDSLRDLAPIVAVILFFELFVLGQPIPNLLDLIVGGAMVVIGLSLFVLGLQLAPPAHLVLERHQARLLGVHALGQSAFALPRRGQGAGDIQRQAIAEGMDTMYQDGLRKALIGLTTIEEVLRVTEED